MYYDGHMSGWGIALMTISGVVFWGLVIAGIVLLVGYVGRSGPSPRQPPGMSTPEQVLAERFARGEIDEPEYTNRLATLRGRVP